MTMLVLQRRRTTVEMTHLQMITTAHYLLSTALPTNQSFAYICTAFKWNKHQVQ